LVLLIALSLGGCVHSTLEPASQAGWTPRDRQLLANVPYYVLPKGKAIRYGVTVGEEALAWSGVATIGRMEEWPAWVPTREIKQRLANIPNYVSPGPHNPMGARALYLYQGNKDTLYRIHGTNQPEYIGQAISSGCIRMTNEDAIDLYNRVRIGATVVVLAPGRGATPVSRTSPTRLAHNN